MNKGLSDLRFHLCYKMNASRVDNNRRGRNPGKGKIPTVFYMTILPMLIFMSEWRSLVIGVDKKYVEV